MNWPEPRSGKEIQRFLGTTNFFRKFIDNYSTIAAPLDPLRNQKKFELTVEQKEAFNNLKAALMKTPVVVFPNFDLPFEIYTDASAVGIGAVLMQGSNVIQFTSRSLSKSERRYSATKRELLAIVFALSKFQYYVLGKKVTVFTDHKPLTYIHTQEQPNHLILKYFETLFLYNFRIQYVKGSENVTADALSRAVCYVGADGEINPDQKRTLLKNSHEGHMSHEKMAYHLMDKGFSWKGLRNDCRKHVAECVVCQRFNIAKHLNEHKGRIYVESPLEQIAIDFAGPFNSTPNGETMLLVIIDLFTGFTWLRPLKNKKAKTVANTLLEIFLDFGLPKILQSDNGTEFVNSIVKELLDKLNVEHRTISEYNPQANGKAENMVKLSKNMLAKLLDEFPMPWSELIPAVQTFLNRRIRTDGEKPFYLMFGRQPNPENDYSGLIVEEGRSKALLTQWKNHLALLESCVRVAMDTEETIEPDVSTGRVPESNDFVMVKAEERKSFTEPRYEGPYQVVRKNRGGAFILKDLKGLQLKRRFPVSKLKIVQLAPNQLNAESSYVKRIIGHREEGNEIDYLTEFYDDPILYWLSKSNFDSKKPISSYHKRIKKNPERVAQILSHKLVGSDVVDYKLSSVVGSPPAVK